MLLPIEKVISGGQTGADLAGLIVAKAFGIPTGGIAAAGFKTVEGERPNTLQAFGLIDLGCGYASRTKLNVEQSDMTLVFASNPGSSGTKLTISWATKQKKPFFLFVCPDSPELFDLTVGQLKAVRDYIQSFGRPVVLNIAGNSTQSGNSQIHEFTMHHLSLLFTSLGYNASV